MHSAAYAMAEALYFICPSVPPFVTFQYCIKTSKHILKPSHVLVALPFLFSRVKHYGEIP